MRTVLFIAAMLWPGSLGTTSVPAEEAAMEAPGDGAEYCRNVERAHRDSLDEDRAVYERQAIEYERSRRTSLWTSVTEPPAPDFDPERHASGSTKYLMKAAAACAAQGF